MLLIIFELLFKLLKVLIDLAAFQVVLVGMVRDLLKIRLAFMQNLDRLMPDVEQCFRATQCLLIAFSVFDLFTVQALFRLPFRIHKKHIYSFSFTFLVFRFSSRAPFSHATSS